MTWKCLLDKKKKDLAVLGEWTGPSLTLEHQKHKGHTAPPRVLLLSQTRRNVRWNIWLVIFERLLSQNSAVKFQATDSADNEKAVIAAGVWTTPRGAAASRINQTERQDPQSTPTEREPSAQWRTHGCLSGNKRRVLTPSNLPHFHRKH